MQRGDGIDGVFLAIEEGDASHRVAAAEPYYDDLTWG